MALLTTISETNRIDEQGGLWEISIKPVWSYVSNGSVMYQWKTSVTFTKSYRYVGLAKSNAISLAETIRNAYTMPRSRYVVSWDKTALHWQYAPISSSTTEADVVPTPMGDGRMWQISVAVAASLEAYYTQQKAPTVATVKGLLSGIDNYPELPGGA